MLRQITFALLTLTRSTAALSATDLTGAWEVQTMGGDREIKIEQRGAKVVAHRILWPEYEGKKYKLEHLYRGTLNGANIVGQLLVKEEETADFEVLRDFAATVSGASALVFDALPLKRVGAPDLGAAQAAPAPAPVAKAPPPATATTATPTPPPSGQAPAHEDSGASLYSSIVAAVPEIMDLFKISAQTQIPGEAVALEAEGDQLLAAGNAKKALAKFEQANKIGTVAHAELLGRMGKCYLALHQYAQAHTVLARALKLDPNNAAVRKDLEVAKKPRP